MAKWSFSLWMCIQKNICGSLLQLLQLNLLTKQQLKMGKYFAKKIGIMLCLRVTNLVFKWYYLHLVMKNSFQASIGSEGSPFFLHLLPSLFLSLSGNYRIDGERKVVRPFAVLIAVNMIYAFAFWERMLSTFAIGISAQSKMLESVFQVERQY